MLIDLVKKSLPTKFLTEFCLSLFKEVFSVTLHNTHKDNKRTKNEGSLAHFLFFIF